MFMFAMGECCVCHAVITFNPNTVPSVRINGSREPVCRACIEKANPERVARGMEPIPIAPDAYEGAEDADIVDVHRAIASALGEDE